MIDRFGKLVYIGWYPHELVWVQAALTLDRKSRAAAIRDIASMTGRALKTVQKQAQRLKVQNSDAAPIAAPVIAAPIPAIFIRPNSPERLRGGNGRVCRSPHRETIAASVAVGIQNVNAQ